MTPLQPEGRGQLVQLTKGMSKTLSQCFDSYAAKGVVNIESNSMGLWLIHPANSTRQFLGKATQSGENTISANSQISAI